MEKAYDKKWFFGQGNWMELDTSEEEQFIEWMRYCYKNDVRENSHGLVTANEFTWENTVNTLMGIKQ